MVIIIIIIIIIIITRARSGGAESQSQYVMIELHEGTRGAAEVAKLRPSLNVSLKNHYHEIFESSSSVHKLHSVKKSRDSLCACVYQYESGRLWVIKKYMITRDSQSFID